LFIWVGFAVSDYRKKGRIAGWNQGTAH
jgi:hypothetical protein